MTRSTVVVVLLLCAALAAVGLGARRFIERDRAETFERFGAERLRVVSEAARELGGDLDEVAITLRLTARLFEDPQTAADPERELRALRAAVKDYRLLVVYDGDGKRLRKVDEPRARGDAGSTAERLPPEDERAIEAALDEAAHYALAHGRNAMSVASSPTRGWSRVFAVAFSRSPGGGPDGAIAVLLDMHRLFDKLHLLASDGSRVLLLGGPGEPTAASDPDLAAAIEHVDDGKARAGRFGELLRRMRAGETGTEALTGTETARLGLGGEELISAFHAIHGEAGGNWSIASLSSTSGLRTHEAAIVRRLGAAAAAVALLLMLFGAFLVVSNRRQVALRERLRHADELAHLHEKTEKILDNIPTGVMALAADGRITAVNRALRDKMPDPAVGGTLAAAFPEAPAATVGRLEALVRSALAAGRVRSVLGEQLALFGEQGQYSVHAVPLEARLPDARVLLVVEDVSEVKQLESQLLRAEKLATIGVLSAGIAHEIGTPLGVVRGRAEYILGKLGPGHSQAQGLSVIVEQIDRVSRTIRQLLDFARVKPATVRAVPVEPAARAVVELLRYEAERRGVEVCVDIPEDLPLVLAEPDQLQQVLVNLSMNAIDACPSSGGHVTIRARPEEPAGGEAGWRRVRIEVIDDGSGIPEELRLQIFDPFFTTKKRGQGTGLGLTMAAEIVRNHGAAIEVESEPGKGTRMIVLWPTGSGARSTAAAASPASNSPAPSTTPQSPKVVGPSDDKPVPPVA